MKYLYNTGRIYWEKEEKGEKLTPDEIFEQNLHFISKVCAMGYLLYRHKEPARAWAIYAMETDEDIESGKHEGGTGKSFFIKLATYIRKHVFIDGQKKSLSDDKHLFGRVLEDFTDLVVIDDLGKHVPLNTLFVAKQQINQNVNEQLNLFNFNQILTHQ